MAHQLRLVKLDPWLEPNAGDIERRYKRFLYRIQDIDTDFGGISKFADGYKYFGFNWDAKRKGWHYREWAPKASELFLFGDFNGWRRFTHPMTMNRYGVWEIFLNEKSYSGTFVHGSKIKVLVNSPAGIRERIPAYIRRVIQDDSTKDFTGQIWFPPAFDWQGDRFKISPGDSLIIYESHVGMAQEKEGIGSYKEFIEVVLPRVKKLGYNTLQLMAVMEHPYYGSFGYHVSNFFAPSSRFGTPEELKELIREAHKMGIAVIMDIVHSHTVKNIFEGLNEFDGSDSQYFHPGERGTHPSWDSKLFDYGKTEVLRFLLSNIKYWLKEFHFDGFRFDGVGSMMYFNHGIELIEDRRKYFSDGVEYDAITYLQLANHLIHLINKNAVSIAEDVTGMPGLCVPVKDGGIGFDYRLGMGIPDFWIKLLEDQRDEEWSIEEIWNVLNNRLKYVKTVAYCESHDQALVGDKTIAFRLMDKEMYSHMSVNDENLIVDRGIALHEMIRLITISLGGQAWLNFMGNEFGHPEWIDFPREGNEWSYKYARRQWSLASDKNLKYKYLEDFDKAMIEMVRIYKILSDEYAEKINLDEENKTIVFRKSGLIFLFNFHPTKSIPDYEFFIPDPGKYQIILNTDNVIFGGHGRIDESIEYFSRWDEQKQSNYLKVYNTNRTGLVFMKIM